jgi:hypothetical protein
MLKKKNSNYVVKHPTRSIKRKSLDIVPIITPPPPKKNPYISSLFWNAIIYSSHTLVWQAVVYVLPF